MTTESIVPTRRRAHWPRWALALAACGGGNIQNAPAPSGGGGQAATAARSTSRSTPGSATRPTRAVVGYVAKSKLGCNVEYKDVKEQVSWQGFGNGEVDVVHGELGPPGPRAEVHHRPEDGPGRRRERQHRHHRLVRAAVDGQAVPGHHGLEQPQQVRRPVQDHGVGRQGPAAGRRPVLRHQRRGAGQEPQPELQGRVRRQRGGADPGVPPGRGEQEAADRLLLRAAVVPVRGAAGQGEPAAVQGRLRRRPGEDRLRLPEVRPEQDRRDQVREGNSPAYELVKAFTLDQRRPERGRQVHRRGQDGPGARPRRSGSTPTRTRSTPGSRPPRPERPVPPRERRPCPRIIGARAPLDPPDLA